MRIAQMWNLERSTASWRSEHLQAVVELALPGEGLQTVTWCGTLLVPAQLMRIEVAASSAPAHLTVDDVYIRGSDVIVTYAETSQCPVRTQVYWRIWEESARGPFVGIEAIVSTQTQQLDSDPRVTISSTLGKSEWFSSVIPGEARGFQPAIFDRSGACQFDTAPDGTAILARVAPIGCSYGHIIPGSDRIAARVVRDPAHQTVTITGEFFDARLEKGVLRRARSWGLLMPRSLDTQHMADRWARVRDAAPPLTT